MNRFLEKIASTEAPAKKPSTLLHALGTEGTAIAAGLAFKAVGSRMGGGRFGNYLNNSKVGRAASRHIWNSVDKVSGKTIPVGGRVLMGELAEYTGSVGGVYGALKYKEHLDEKKSKNKYLNKAASYLDGIKIQTERG